MGVIKVSESPAKPRGEAARSEAARRFDSARASRPLTSPRRTRIVLVLAALVGIAMLVDAAGLWRAMRWNERIASGVPVPARAEAPREVRFAAAHAAAASGATDAALNLYRTLQDDTPLGQAARFNSANLLLRRAIEIRDTPQPGQAIPLLELAKETYREVLRTDPQHWAARYNLERAQRLHPDPDDADAEPPSPGRNAERAATTMRGYSPGLP